MAAHHFYLTCPSCGQRILDPFSRTSGPIPYVHRTKRYGQRIQCRLIVIPDPKTNRHSAKVIEKPLRLEEALAMALDEAA